VLLVTGCSGGGDGSSSATGPTSQTAATADFGGNDPRKVTAFGDSITLGELGLRRRDLGLVTSSNYPALLQAQLQSVDPAWRVVNRGAGGEHSSEGARRLGSVLAVDRPGFVLILEGTNDAHQCHDAGALVANLGAMVDTARGRKTIPILGTLPPSFRNDPCADDVIATANAQIRGLASAEGIPLAEIFGGMNDRSLFGVTPDRDPLHPNERGYAVMASIWADALTQASPGGLGVALRRAASRPRAPQPWRPAR
jgi:lysophospholipase L1-like esterase